MIQKEREKDKTASVPFFIRIYTITLNRLSAMSSVFFGDMDFRDFAVFH